MSGAYNQPVKGGWNIFEPQGPTGKFSKYDNRIVVIVAERTKKNRQDGVAIYFTKATLRALKNPDRIMIATRGSNIGIWDAGGDKRSYKICHASKEGEDKGTPFVNLSAFGKAYNVSVGVYDAHMEGDVLTFDTQSPPSRF